MIFQSLQFRCTSRLACSDLMTNEPPSSPKLSPHPLCFCSCWNTVQDLLQIVYFILVDQAPFCMSRINLLPRQSTGEEKKVLSFWMERWLGKRLCEFTERYCYETSVLFCSIVQITRKKWLSQNDEREYTRYFYISQTQDVVSQPLIHLWGFPFLTIISKLKIDQKNASFKMRSILQVERKPLKNPRSFCQAYELQITDMLAQENPYLPNAHRYLLCDVSFRCQAAGSLADTTDFRHHWFSWTG